jgi:hypothetical protein
MVGRPERGRLVARKLTDYSLQLYAARRPGRATGAHDRAGTGATPPGRLRRRPDRGARLNYTAEFLRRWRSHCEISSAIGQVEAVRRGRHRRVPDYLARHPELVVVMPEMRAVHSYWLAIYEDLRDVARARAVDFVVETTREDQQTSCPGPS